MSGDPRCDVHSNTSDIRSNFLNLAGVDTCPHLHAKVPCSAPDLLGTSNRPSWTVKRGDEPVARRVHFRSPESDNLSSNQIIVGFEEFAPPLVAKIDSSTGRLDHVCDENRRQNPVGFCRHSETSQELTDLGEG